MFGSCPYRDRAFDYYGDGDFDHGDGDGDDGDG